MTLVTVFRHAPRPITGMIGVLYDRAFEAFEANLGWLETTGVLVERFDPTTAPGEVACRPRRSATAAGKWPRTHPRNGWLRVEASS